MVVVGPIVFASLATDPSALADETTEPPPPTPIVGGEEVPLGRWDAVGAFIVGSHLCTGTMVTSHLMLTAGHCLTDLQGTAPDEVAILFGPSAFMPAASTTATQVGVFPDYCSECVHDRFDLGYVLARDPVVLPADFPPLVTDQDTWDEVMVDGRALVAVGYGQERDGTPTGGADLGSGIKREVELAYRGFSDNGLDFRAGEEGSGTCAGDSGGPAFVELEDGRWGLAGLLSGGFGACGEGSLFMVPLPALPWIREETGVDLLPADCPDADCVDTFLDPEGCGCRSSSSPTSAIGLLLPLLLPLARRIPRC